MGIILLPFMLGALIIGVLAIFKTVKHYKAATITIKELIFGIITSFVLFGFICLSYILEGKAWGLSPAFRIPVFMVFIPFIVHLLTQKNEQKQIEYISKILLISVAFTVILCVLFSSFIFNLIDFLGIPKSY